jgi:hypothetical protein
MVLVSSAERMLFVSWFASARLAVGVYSLADALSWKRREIILKLFGNPGKLYEAISCDEYLTGPNE